jgi:hypothetical protein
MDLKQNRAGTPDAALAEWSMGQVEPGLQLPEPLVGKLGPMLPGQKTRARIQHAVDQVVDPIV